MSEEWILNPIINLIIIIIIIGGEIRKNFLVRQLQIKLFIYLFFLIYEFFKLENSFPLSEELLKYRPT